MEEKKLLYMILAVSALSLVLSLVALYLLYAAAPTVPANSVSDWF